MPAWGFDKPLTWIIILAIVLLIFGAGKLPEIGKSFGKSIKEFKSEVNTGLKDGPVTEVKSDVMNSTEPDVTVRRTIRKLEDGTEEIVEERVVRKQA